MFKKISNKSFTNVIANPKKLRNNNKCIFLIRTGTLVFTSGTGFSSDFFHLLDPELLSPCRSGSRRPLLMRIRIPLTPLTLIFLLSQERRSLMPDLFSASSSRPAQVSLIFQGSFSTHPHHLMSETVCILYHRTCLFMV